MKNTDYIRNKEKKERALNYWKDRVSQDFLPPIDPLKKYRGESLDKLTKLREELIPQRIVTNIKDLSRKTGFKIKQQRAPNEQGDLSQSSIAYNEEEIEKGLVGKLPDSVSGGEAAGSGNMKLKRDPSKRVHKGSSKKLNRYEEANSTAE